ncbi:YihY/virulence factor BrkB family protein [Variovorax ginsengisoli]|uniref:YihY/virulence factor BrkB family protein n=1 Tax=Variovorax ginsengisoli TaxID=363844 RepID=A0ABT8SFD7_9BURK|nr:YihY/virulence factor BrkB family protein [Variovorax ginsengisoli]MDN8617697.1 YihY/virulence factor BrkB family protein [Variovorax ginsengisoli]MDO1536867.1 YihY/virulence factor BrkB family protein [Variovorax ginsengisoli]
MIRRSLTHPIGPVLRHPLRFIWQAFKSFKANQGLLLAGAVAYYALLSIVPLLIVSVIALSHFVDQAALLSAVGRYLAWLLPGQSQAIVAELSNFLTHAEVLGPVLLVTMIFFSSLAFTVLEGAMAVIFHHRKAEHSRHFLISVVMPYVYILCLCVGLMLVTLVTGALQVIGEESVELFGYSWSLSGVSGVLLYLLGLGGEIFMLTSLYLVMPVGRLRLRHALIGGVTAALLWEVTRRVLVFYFATLSQVNVVYGSLTTAIVVLLSLEIAATLVLFGAQVIAQFERLERTGSLKPDEAADGALGGQPPDERGHPGRRRAAPRRPAAPSGGSDYTK